MLKRLFQFLSDWSKSDFEIAVRELVKQDLAFADNINAAAVLVAGNHRRFNFWAPLAYHRGDTDADALMYIRDMAELTMRRPKLVDGNWRGHTMTEALLLVVHQINERGQLYRDRAEVDVVVGRFARAEETCRRIEEILSRQISSPFRF